MDRWKLGEEPTYWCDHCGADNWEPDPQCAVCHEFQPDSRTGRLMARIDREDRRDPMHRS